VWCSAASFLLAFALVLCVVRCAINVGFLRASYVTRVILQRVLHRFFVVSALHKTSVSLEHNISVLRMCLHSPSCALVCRICWKQHGRLSAETHHISCCISVKKQLFLLQ
jgi:hypothetical protein